VETELEYPFGGVDHTEYVKLKTSVSSEVVLSLSFDFRRPVRWKYVFGVRGSPFPTFTLERGIEEWEKKKNENRKTNQCRVSNANAGNYVVLLCVV
jgi:hypothetical protein